jgi:hypothetical protein
MVTQRGNKLTFWAPCLKNVLAKVSKMQLRNPAPVTEILPLWTNSVLQNKQKIQLWCHSIFEYINFRHSSRGMIITYYHNLIWLYQHKISIIIELLQQKISFKVNSLLNNINKSFKLKNIHFILQSAPKNLNLS